MSKTKQLIVYFAVTFGFSWLVWSPFILAGFGLYPMSETLSSLMMLAVIIGAFGPLVGAVVVQYKIGRWPQVKSFLKHCLRFRTKPLYYILAIVIPFGVTVIAHYITTGFGISNLPTTLMPEELTISPVVLVLPYALLMLVLGGGQEEFGWRGFAQDKLQDKFGILLGSSFLGLMWGLWHAPLWIMPGEGHENYSFIAFVLFTIIFSIMISILYNISDKKMVIPWVMHAASNTSVPLFPILFLEDVDQPGYWIWVAVNFVATTILVLWYYKRKQLTPKTA
ncbi:type II CAAX endopeptidase family protein [Candidatus Xianfuyuplasma coldseepsis]|uniref:CPBP family intramembrane metalloprotease n=1 Tax=Candidatus Xianfuyuplasma coldseepsis TaxID=2782163 RepID=A0A7L7KST0_9MOLU|nr:type II CAAX endopeptidase family protein [Xianfuyuplasma coldseepsis]QMS85286.1 CPBP family intramembrane metalloprotease [Xianfuyuplasma coldseepsis]